MGTQLSHLLEDVRDTAYDVDDIHLIRATLFLLPHARQISDDTRIMSALQIVLRHFQDIEEEKEARACVAAAAAGRAAAAARAFAAAAAAGAGQETRGRVTTATAAAAGDEEDEAGNKEDEAGNGDIWYDAEEHVVSGPEDQEEDRVFNYPWVGKRYLVRDGDEWLRIRVSYWQGEFRKYRLDIDDGSKTLYQYWRPYKFFDRRNVRHFV